MSVFEPHRPAPVFLQGVMCGLDIVLLFANLEWPVHARVLYHPEILKIIC